MTHLDMTGYGLAPRDCTSAAQVMEAAARSQAFRQSLRPRPPVFIIPRVEPEATIAPAAPELPQIFPEWPQIRLRGQCLNDYANAAGDYPAPTRGKRGPSIDAIQRVVCTHFNISKKDLISVRRDWTVCRPRQLAMWLCRKVTSQTYPEIGRRFGGRDHTTGINAFDKIEALRAAGDPKICSAIPMLADKLAVFIPD